MKFLPSLFFSQQFFKLHFLPNFRGDGDRFHDRNNDINNMYNGKFEIERIRILQSCIEGFNKPCLAAGSFVELSVVDDSNYPTTPGCRVHRINK